MTSATRRFRRPARHRRAAGVSRCVRWRRFSS